MIVYGFLWSKIAYRGRLAGWFGSERCVKFLNGPCQRPICFCCSLRLVGSCVEKKQTIHASTSTPLPTQHRTMYPVWRKSRLPHRSRRRETLQPQKATQFAAILVVCRKPPHPHKEKKKFCPFIGGEVGRATAAASINKNLKKG